MQNSSNSFDRVVSQIENWRSHLLDIGNRNPLINTSFSQSRGVIELVHPTPESLWRKLSTAVESSGKTLRFPRKRELVRPPAKVDSTASLAQPAPELQPDSVVEVETELKDWNPPLVECQASARLLSYDILTHIGDRALDRRIRTLKSYADLSISEQGIHCLFLAFGFVKWFESRDSNKELRSPLILVPAIFTRPSSDSPWELQGVEDDLVDNLCLRQRLKQDFGLELPPLPESDQLEEYGAIPAFFEEVRKRISKQPRWEVEDRCCVGRFAFPKIAMWQDLGDHIEAITSNAICQSIAGQISNQAD